MATAKQFSSGGGSAAPRDYVKELYNRNKKAQQAQVLTNLQKGLTMRGTQQGSPSEPKPRPPVTDGRVAGLFAGNTGGGAPTGGGYDPATYAGGGTVGGQPYSGGGGSGDFNSGETQTRTGFGNSIMPGAYGDAYSDPDALIRKYFSYTNMPTAGGAYAQALQQSDRLKALWLLLQGQNANSNANFIDWTGQYLGNQFTPGGPSLGMGDIASAIQGALGDENSILGKYVTNEGLTPSDQVGNFGSYLRQVMGGTAPDIVQMAILSRIASLGDDFRAKALGEAQPDSFAQYAGDQGLWSMFGK